MGRSWRAPESRPVPSDQLKVEPEIIVYSRRGCHLCEDLLAELEPMVRGRARICVRDVDDDPEWLSAYSERVPVVCLNGEEICEFRLDRQAVWSKISPDGT
jgi:hypothetical protein